MLDLTKEIVLNKKNYRIYRKLQLTLYFLAFLLAAYLFYLALFPSAYFTFSFLNPNSLQNNIVSLRYSSGDFPERGQTRNTDDLYFDAALSGKYSTAKIYFKLNKKSQIPEKTSLEIQKSFQSFFYPEASPLGFKNGTLVKNETDYFIVSQDKLRKFSGEDVLKGLGFNKDAFFEVSKKDLSYNLEGEDISGFSYPDNSIFKINEEYYILENQKLKKFISQNAYLTQYSENQAISENEEFLGKYPLDENLLGFADGTLVSYGISAFVVSSGKILPINNVATFSAMGYNWNDVVAASGDEISLYEKDKLFTLSSPHPNGTVFFAREDSRWYLVKDQKKYPLPTESIAKSWISKNPVLVSFESLEAKEACELQKELLSFRTYSCEIPLEKFSKFLGKDYQFKLNSEKEIKIDNVDITFKKTLSLDNLKLSILNTLSRIK